MTKLPIILFPYIFTIRIIASLLSIAGAYLYVFDFLYATIKLSVISYFLSAVFLIFIELGSIIFLISFFQLLKSRKKNRTDISISILFFLIAVSFLSLSFFLTTKGASQWVVHSGTNSLNNKLEFLPSNDISFKYGEQLKNARLIYDSLSNVPAHRYKSVRLQQLNKLEYYKNQVSYFQKLMQEEKEESKANILNEEKLNTRFIQDYSEKYYGFAVLIMVLVFISNFLSFWLTDHKNNTLTDQNKTNIHEYNICNSSPCSNQVEDLLKSDLSKTEKIYALFKAKYSQKQIAEYMNISQSTVSRSLNGIV